MEIENAPILKYIFNETGKIGGYPMVEILQKEIKKEKLLGSNKFEIGTKRFENLVIPVGILSFSDEYYMKGGEQEKQPIIKEKIHDSIDNELYNKVFDLITKCPGKSRTKKNIEKITKNISKKITKTKKRLTIK